MAFYFVTGVMGSGKSYCGAELILQCLREGGYVHTNLPLRMDNLQEYRERIVFLPRDIRNLVRVVPAKVGPDGIMGEEMLESDFIRGGVEGAENLVVFDEASIHLSVDEQMNRDEKERNKPLFKLVALCRHVGLDLYFLAQDAGHVNSKLRDLAEYRIKCVKTERIPMAGWLLAMLPWMGTFLRIYYTGKSKQATGRTWHQFRKEVGDIYNTHGMRDGVMIKTAATRRKGMDVTQRKGKFVAAMVAALMLSLVGYSVFAGRKAYAEVTGEKKGTAVPETAAAQAPSADASKAAASAPAKATTQERRGDWVEWQSEDERPFFAVMQGSKGVRVLWEGGTWLYVGGYCEGEVLTRLVCYGGWYYFWSATGRVFVARPLTGEERRERSKPKKKPFLASFDKLTGEPK